jgi:ABC-type Fe3+ transport system permease subunit
VLGQFSTAVVGLTLVQSAYTAEIIRGGFLGVDHGQYEAAAALGLPAWRRTLRIILPQALRTILPSGFNEIISLAKGTAMVYVLAMPELFYTIQMIYNRTQEVIPLLMVGAAWYLAITSVLSAIQYLVERPGAQRAPLGGKQRPQQPSESTRTSTTAAGGRSCPALVMAISLSPASANTMAATKRWTMCRWRSPGTVTVILGPSGSGKSTLLRTINHLERVDEGLFRLMATISAIAAKATSCMR